MNLDKPTSDLEALANRLSAAGYATEIHEEQTGDGPKTYLSATRGESPTARDLVISEDDVKLAVASKIEYYSFLRGYDAVWSGTDGLSSRGV